MFNQQTVLITGASSGIGEACARAFAREGARLILLARRKERLKKIAAELKVPTLCLEVDVSKAEEVKEALSTLVDPFSNPDILINNAGLAKGLSQMWQTSSEEWDQMIDTNVKGILHVSKEIVPRMIKAGRGHIINVGSISSRDTYPGGSVYCATKFAVRALTDTLRKELVETPLRVSMISPGLVQTEFSDVRFSGDKAKSEAVYEKIKPLNGDDIAECVLFMASRPPHVQVVDLIVYPTQQASVSLVHRSM